MMQGSARQHGPATQRPTGRAEEDFEALRATLVAEAHRKARRAALWNTIGLIAAAVIGAAVAFWHR